jgi:hypothetical protein
MHFLDAPQSPLENILRGNFLDPLQQISSTRKCANFTQALGSVRSFKPAEIPHGDDPTDDAQTSDDIGVERHLWRKRVHDFTVKKLSLMSTSTTQSQSWHW